MEERRWWCARRRGGGVVRRWPDPARVPGERSEVRVVGVGGRVAISINSIGSRAPACRPARLYSASTRAAINNTLRRSSSLVCGEKNV